MKENPYRKQAEEDFFPFSLLFDFDEKEEGWGVNQERTQWVNLQLILPNTADNDKIENHRPVFIFQVIPVICRCIRTCSLIRLRKPPKGFFNWWN